MPDTAYVVAAPKRYDIMSSTLRCAYPQTQATTEPFADIFAILDNIELSAGAAKSTRYDG